MVTTTGVRTPTTSDARGLRPPAGHMRAFLRSVAFSWFPLGLEAPEALKGGDQCRTAFAACVDGRRFNL